MEKLKINGLKPNGPLLVASQVVILLVIVLPFIGRPYWDDELFSIRTAASIEVMLDTCKRFENNMVGYYFLLHGWIRMFGNTEAATRSLSLIFAMLSLFSFWPLARRFFSPLVAGASGLLLAINPLFLHNAIETRGYSLLLLGSIVSTLLFFQLLERRSWWKSVLYGLVLSFSVYTHYFGLLLLPIHACFTFLLKTSIRQKIQFAIIWMLSVASASPLWIFKPASLEQVLWLPTPTLEMLVKGGGALFGGAKFLLAFMFVAAFVWLRRRIVQEKLALEVFFLGCVWVCLPMCIVFLYSIVKQPLFQYRYFIWVLPGAALLVGFLAHYALNISSRLFGLIVMIALAQVIPAFQVLRGKGTGYKDATTFIVKNAVPGDAVIAYPYFKADHFSHFLERQAPQKTSLKPQSFSSGEYLPGGGGRDPDPDLQRLTSIAADAHRVFLVCNPGPREADGRQNREGLPVIEQQLSRRFPFRQSHIFGEGFEAPTRVIVFSR